MYRVPTKSSIPCQDEQIEGPHRQPKWIHTQPQMARNQNPLFQYTWKTGEASSHQRKRKRKQQRQRMQEAQIVKRMKQQAQSKQRIRLNSERLVIDGKVIPTIQIKGFYLKDPQSTRCFHNSHHFLYFEGCSIDDCSICLQANTEGTKMTHLFCKHVFHTQCIHSWLKLKDYCPLCNQDFQKHEQFKYVEQKVRQQFCRQFDALYNEPFPNRKARRRRQKEKKNLEEKN